MEGKFPLSERFEVVGMIPVSVSIVRDARAQALADMLSELLRQEIVAMEVTEEMKRVGWQAGKIRKGKKGGEVK